MRKSVRERSIMSAYDLNKTPVKTGYGIMLLILIVISITMLYPFFMTLFGSLKTKEEIFVFPPTFFPHHTAWSNYKEGWTYLNLTRAFGNTLLLYVGNAIGAMLIPGLAAFSLAHMKLGARKLATMFFMSTLMIPSATYLIPNFLNLKSLGLLDSYWAFWLPAGASAFNILLMKGFFDGLNKELFEAARMDGASELRCFFNVAVPLSLPVISTLMIFAFTATWNDWYWPSLVLSVKEKYPISSLVYYDIVNAQKITWNVKFSVLTIIMFPPLIFFLIFQKNIMHGLNLSGVKG